MYILFCNNIWRYCIATQDDWDTIVPVGEFKTSDEAIEAWIRECSPEHMDRIQCPAEGWYYAYRGA